MINNNLIFIFLFLVIILCTICYNLEKFTNNHSYNIKIIKNSRSDYLPLMLYSEILFKSLNKLQYNVELVDNFSSINSFENSIVILYLFEYKEDTQTYLEENKIKTILINTEYYEHFGFNDKIARINNNNLDCTIFEYSCVNYKIIKEKYPNVNIYYAPLLYHEYLSEYYSTNLIDVNKDIDVLVFGAISERRRNLINILNKKYNVVYFTNGVSNDELFKYIKRSKIILNAHNHNYHFVFDYYRNAFLIANNIFFIYEYPYDIDYSIDKNLIGMEESLVVVKYDNIIDTVEYYLNNPELINNQLIKQNEWFKKNTFENNIKLYFEKI
jgi:hypothetical protein